MATTGEINGIKKTCKRFVNKYKEETTKIEKMLKLAKVDADLYIQMCEVAEKSIKFSTEFTTKWQTIVAPYVNQKGKSHLAHFSHFGNYLYPVSDKHPDKPEYYEALVPISKEYFAYDKVNDKIVLKH